MVDATLLQEINEAQRQAVTAPPGPVLVLAGAGSGKTRVLVQRLVYLVLTEQITPSAILAVTFTNKAAGEMRARLEQILGQPVGALWVGTFHGLANRMLRQHWQQAHLPQNFQILDSEDQRRLLKRVLRALELDEDRWPVRQFQGFINARKEEGLRPAQLGDTGDPTYRQLVRVYVAYENACAQNGLVDFTELLLRAYELLRDDAGLLAHYRERFRHILVDEFQDTNSLQYAWLRLLAGSRGKLYVVGDDDQSIYSWRGARSEHLTRFSQDYPDAQVVRLEQNYRSTATILKAANRLISHNRDRLGKELWTDGAEGEPIRLYAAFNEQDEAAFVVDRIRNYSQNGYARREIGVLYRSNAQSRVLEEALVNAGVPYRVYGGLRFFDRAEVKDALAYLRLLRNPNDDASFERIVNLPVRGIGNRTLELLRGHAQQRRLSLWQASLELSQGGTGAALSARAAAALRGFLTLIEGLTQASAEQTLAEQMELVIQDSGLLAHHQQDKSDQGEARAENLRELVNAARGFVSDNETIPAVDAFLSHAALEAGEAQGNSWEDCVQLMTLHSAKGLEFPIVFLVGMEEGLFPHQRALEDADGLEEERRLAYVGMTRAMQILYLSYAERRRLYGSETQSVPSRFIHEIPAELLQEIRPRLQVSRPLLSQNAPALTSPEGLRLGQRVSHPIFGEGVILNFEGQGPNMRIQVNFKRVGSKWLVSSYAKLAPA
jgi:DNA helicase-2/ATP-dependent DNA helicase PcrA